MSEVVVVTLLGVNSGRPVVEKQQVFSPANVDRAELWFEKLAKNDTDYVQEDLDDYLERGFYEDANRSQLITIVWKNVE